MSTDTTAKTRQKNYLIEQLLDNRITAAQLAELCPLVDAKGGSVAIRKTRSS